jgi:hypothetical protein
MLLVVAVFSAGGRGTLRDQRRAINGSSAPPSIAEAIAAVQQTESRASLKAGPIPVDPPPIPATLGSGWSFTRRATASLACISGTPNPNVPRRTYETAGEYADTSTLAQGLNISAHAQASFLIGKANADVKYVLNQKVAGSSDRIAVYAGIRDLYALTPKPASLGQDTAASALLKASTPKPSDAATPNSAVFGALSVSPESLVAISGDGISLTPTALKILSRQGRAAFEEQCGQGYIEAIETGADLVGFYRIDSSNIEVKHQVTGSLGGSVLGQSANVSLDRLTNSVNNSSAEFIDFQQFGGSPQSLPKDKTGFLKAIEGFPATIPPVASGKETPANQFKIYVAPYGPGTVANWPSKVPGFSPSAETPLDHLTEEYWLLDALYEQLGAVITTPSDYILNWGVTLNDVKAHQGEILEAQRKLQQLVQTCDESGDCAGVASMASTEAYYYHLARLPIPKTWSSEYNGLTATLQRAQTAVSKYNTDHQGLITLSQTAGILMFSPEADPTCYKRNDFNHKVMVPSFKQNVEPVINDLRLRDANLPAQLRQVLRNTFFETTNHSRCGLSRSGFGCASALELDAWSQRMPLGPPHGVSTNEGDDKVFGECPPHDLVLTYAQ